MGAPVCSGISLPLGKGVCLPWAVCTQNPQERKQIPREMSFFLKEKKKKGAGWISLLTGKSTVLGKLDPVKALLGTSNRYSG